MNTAATAGTNARLKAAHDKVEVAHRDLSPFRRGNTGTDYVFRFESGKPGPTVLINGLTHGNEPCGLEAVVHLLEAGVRPRIGTLILSIANIEAYEVPDVDGLPGSRFLDQNLSRVWTREHLDGADDGVELRRARELRPFAAVADVLLDIHSTPYNPTPFFPLRPQPRRQALASRLGHPATHVLIPEHVLGDASMADYGRLGEADGSATGLAVECGLHYAQASVDIAISTSSRLLALNGLVDAELAGRWTDPRPRRDFVMTDMVHSRTGDVRYLFEPSQYRTFSAGDVVAYDGDEPIRALYDDCCPLWVPKRVAPGGMALIFSRASAVAV